MKRKTLLGLFFFFFGTDIEVRSSGVAASRGAPLPFSGVAPGAVSAGSQSTATVSHINCRPPACRVRSVFPHIPDLRAVLRTMALGKDHAGDRRSRYTRACFDIFDL